MTEESQEERTFESTIHGVNYIIDHRSPKATRTFWILAFILSIIGCVYYAVQVYDKLFINPDIGLKSEFISSRNIPFPALTICPQNKVFLDLDQTLDLELNLKKKKIKRNRKFGRKNYRKLNRSSTT